MSNLTPQAQAVITAFGSEPSVTQDHVNNLQAVINASPALISQINDAVAQEHLQRILPLTNPHAGGEYHGKNGEMHLPIAKLTTPPPNQTFDAGEVTFVLGHELQHGFNHAATKQAYQDFMTDAKQAAKTDHDYTAEVGKLLDANRRDEAGAEIAGWNAIVSRVKTTNPTPTMKDIFRETGRMSDFINVNKSTSITYTLKPNLTLNPDLTLTPSPANFHAMGQNFFDKPPIYPGGLGPLGNSDYANLYGTWPIQEAAKLERHYNPQPSMVANLSQLRLSEKLLEENGINLGNNPQPVPYVDTSTTPPKTGLFQHTANSHQHTSPVSAQAFEAELAQEQRGSLSSRAALPADTTPTPVRPQPTRSDEVPAPVPPAQPQPSASVIPEHLRDFRHQGHPLHARYSADLNKHVANPQTLQTIARENVPSLQLPSTPAPQTQAPDSQLRLGDHGIEVLALQASLIQLNINDRIKTPVQANGIYGGETQRAVQAFQLWHGMDEVNGIADRATREAVQQQAGLAIQQRGVDPSQEQSDQQQARQHQQRDWQVQQDQRMQEPARLKEEETSRQQEQDQDQPPELQSFSDPKHPEHALYADLKQRLEAQGHAFPDDRLNQIVGTLHDERFKPGWRGAVDVENDSVYVTDNARPWARSQTLLQEPAPSIQDTMQAVHTKDLEKAQEQSQSPDPPTQGPTRTR